MQVRIYYNLHRKCLSVQHKTPHGWRVWHYANQIALSNVVFKVSEAGRQRVLREQKKNVHAFVEGHLITGGMIPDLSEFNREISYNPYKMNSFFDKKTQQSVDGAAFVVISGKDIKAHAPKYQGQTI